MTAIAILSRAPMPGHAKTRLAPLLGDAGAARLQHWLLERSLDTASAAGLGPLWLWGSPDHRHPAFAACAGRYPLELRSQPEGDLGHRMQRAATASMSRAGVLLIGTDCPVMTPADLRAAAARLAEGDEAVVIPAEDGGYVLIGLRRVDAGLFADIDWGTPQVMQQTRERLVARGLRWSELPPLWDVDRPEDLARLVDREPSLSAWLQAV